MFPFLIKKEKMLNCGKITLKVIFHAKSQKLCCDEPVRDHLVKAGTVSNLRL